MTTATPALDLRTETEVFQQTRKTVVNPFIDAVKALTVNAPGVSVAVPSDDPEDETVKTYNRYLTEAGNVVGVTVRREIRTTGEGKNAEHRLHFQAVPKIKRQPQTPEQIAAATAKRNATRLANKAAKGAAKPAAPKK